MMNKTNKKIINLDKKKQNKTKKQKKNKKKNKKTKSRKKNNGIPTCIRKKRSSIVVSYDITTCISLSFSKKLDCS